MICQGRDSGMWINVGLAIEPFCIILHSVYASMEEADKALQYGKPHAIGMFASCLHSLFLLILGILPTHWMHSCYLWWKAWSIARRLGARRSMLEVLPRRYARKLATKAVNKAVSSGQSGDGSKNRKLVKTPAEFWVYLSCNVRWVTEIRQDSVA